MGVRPSAITLRPEYFHDLIGMTVFDQVARIVKGTGHDPTKAYHAREEHFWGLIDQLEPMVGVVRPDPSPARGRYPDRHRQQRLPRLPSSTSSTR